MRSPTIKLKYIQRYYDRHGKLRIYLRVPGYKRKLLPNIEDDSFLECYNNALKECASQKRSASVKKKILRNLIGEWYSSPNYLANKDSTKLTYKRILEYMRSQPYAEFNVSDFKTIHIKKIIDQKATTPARANHILRLFKMLFSYSIDIGWRIDDPTHGIKRLRMKEQGVEAWSEEQIRQYEEYWPTGTMQRLALSILLYTGQRRSDVVKMGPRNIKNNAIEVTQQKTGTKLTVPIHSNLEKEINYHLDHKTFLHRKNGEAFTANGFYMRFKAWREEAGLPSGLSPHGLRKAAARRLAEAGCSAHQIASITGHSTLSEVERYTRSVRQSKLAIDAIRALNEGKRLDNE